MNVTTRDTATSDTTLHRRSAATPDQLPILRHTLTTWLRALGAPSAAIDAITLATYEAMANTVVHAYPGRTGEVTLHAAADHTTLAVTITDHGRWQPATPHPGPLNGRGIPLIHGLSDTASITTSPHGTTVRMTWTRAAPMAA